MTQLRHDHDTAVARWQNAEFTPKKYLFFMLLLMPFFLQILIYEGEREEIFNRVKTIDAARTREQDLYRLVITRLHLKDDLTARATRRHRGRTQAMSIGCRNGQHPDRLIGEVSLSRKHGGALSTEPRGESSVLLVGTYHDLPIIQKHGCSHTKLTIRRIGVVCSLTRIFYKLLLIHRQFVKRAGVVVTLQL